MWVRDVWFRRVHLAVIGLAAVQAWLGFICPLTTCGDDLRLLAGGKDRYAGPSTQHWLHPLNFFEVEGSGFRMAYVGFLVAVVTSWWLGPPRRPKKTA